MNAIYFSVSYTTVWGCIWFRMAQNLGNLSILIQERDIPAKPSYHLSDRALKKKSWHLAIDFNQVGSCYLFMWG